MRYTKDSAKGKLPPQIAPNGVITQTKPQFHICQSTSELAITVAEQIIDICNSAIAQRGTCFVALAGGSTPRDVYCLLAGASHRERVDWSAVQLFWGDERAVPPSHHDSNFRMANETLLSGVDILSANVHRMRGEIEPESAAAEYAQLLEQTFDTQPPQFDLVLLGVGGDGHTASLFPGTAAVAERDRSVTAVFVEKMNAWRITLTLPVLNAARHVIFTVAGEAKGEIVKMIMKLHQPSPELPASLVLPSQGQLYWFLDAAAGAPVREVQAL